MKEDGTNRSDEFTMAESEALSHLSPVRFTRGVLILGKQGEMD